MDMNNQQIELIIQKHNGIKWPCICGSARAKESELLCEECWGRIPQAKRDGFRRLESDLMEHALEHQAAAEQILRIAERNLSQREAAETADEKPDCHPLNTI